jgi:hypothetical protein
MTELDPAALADAVRETGIALRPGDVLAVRLPMSISHTDMNSARHFARMTEAETGIKVAFIPGEEFSHTTVNINITVNGTASTREIAEVIQREIDYRRRNGAPSPDVHIP